LITGELHFCAHHAKQFDASLKKIAVEIVDETDRLDSPTRTGSADA
jgi:hypothetical protein